MYRLDTIDLVLAGALIAALAASAAGPLPAGTHRAASAIPARDPARQIRHAMPATASAPGIHPDRRA